jgi:ketosteroid isomerase-like protein
MPMSHSLGVLALLTMLAAGCQPRVSGGTAADQAIIAQERRALAQWAEGNPLGYLATVADDVTYFDDIGAHTRIDGIEALRAYFTSLQGKIKPHRYELVDPKVQLYGDIGILTLRYRASTIDGQPVAHWKASSVYRRVSGEWRIVHAHWSLVKGKEARPAGS